MRKKICLITSGHIASNPRIVKEADALSEAGYEVKVIYNNTLEFIRSYDKTILEKAEWKYSTIDEVSIKNIFIHRIFSFLSGLLKNYKIFISKLSDQTLSPVTKQLKIAAAQEYADLYIAHTLPALPAASHAALKNNSLFGFDAEDFHSEENVFKNENIHKKYSVIETEDKYLGKAAYLTSSSPGISEEYEKKYNIKMKPVLNVFPLSYAEGITKRKSENIKIFSIYWFSQTIGNDRGLEQIINAISLMQTQAVLNLRGHISSSGYYIEKLKKHAHSRNVKVKFLNAEPPGKMVKLASENDLGLSTELSNPLNRDICLTNKIFTYLLAGIPVLLSKTRAQAAIAEELGDAAILVDINNPDEVAEKLDEYFSSPEKMANAKKTAMQLAETKYNWDIEKIKFLEIVEKALN